MCYTVKYKYRLLSIKSVKDTKQSGIYYFAVARLFIGLVRTNQIQSLNLSWLHKIRAWSRWREFSLNSHRLHFSFLICCRNYFEFSFSTFTLKSFFFLMKSRLNLHLSDPLSLNSKQGFPTGGRHVKPSFITRPLRKVEKFEPPTWEIKTWNVCVDSFSLLKYSPRVCFSAFSFLRCGQKLRKKINST